MLINAWLIGNTNLQVTGYLDGSSFVVTTTYVEPRNPVIQGSYVELPVMHDADKFTIEVVSTNSINVITISIPRIRKLPSQQT
jgi:hypothetical protein